MEKDESFYSDKEFDRLYPEWRNIHDFDHHFLRRLGLPCGPDSPADSYALCRDVGGWRVWRVRDLVDLMFTDEEWKKFKETFREDT